MKICVEIMLVAIFTLYSCSDDTESEETLESNFTISSIAVADGELLEVYKCEEKIDSVEQSIPLSWSNIPEEASSLAIAMTHYPDPDDLTNISSYLLLWDIDTSISTIPYGTADEGSWFMGSNKDGNAISYSSPCSQGTGSHEYTITIYALSDTPSSLPSMSTIAVTYDVFSEALSTVTVIDTATLTFNSTTL
tara:strand:- start:2529 stop:3107 length:579 start_codon:yes stop_codon:yes gene_type:complete